MIQVIDVHAHYYPPAYLAAVSKLVNEPGRAGDAARATTFHPFIHRHPYFTGAFQERLALMDRAGIRIQILSFSSPNVWHPDPTVRTDLARIFNDACAQVCQQYRGRFKFFANLPLPFVDEACREAARILEHPDAVGLGICTHNADMSLDDPRFDPFYTFVNEQPKSVLFLHPDPEPVAGYLSDPAMAWALGAPFEDTIALYHLLRSGLLERFPNIRWIVPHCGGVLPALIGRIDEIWEQNPDPHVPLPASPSAYLRSRPVYVDSATPQASLLSLAHHLFDSHLLFGSDFPYIKKSLLDLSVALRPIGELACSEQEKQRLLFQNALDLFSIA